MTASWISLNVTADAAAFEERAMIVEDGFAETFGVALLLGDHPVVQLVLAGGLVASAEHERLHLLDERVRQRHRRPVVVNPREHDWRMGVADDADDLVDEPAGRVVARVLLQHVP
jgi:hypothetical protein